MREHYNQLASTSQNKLKNILNKNTFQTSILTSHHLSPPQSTSLITLQVSRENINQAVQIYFWRSKTSLPILRVEQYRISPLKTLGTQKREFIFDDQSNKNLKKWDEQKKSKQNLTEYAKTHPEVPSYEVTIKMEDFRCRLSDMNTFSFPQTMYLLKEMLVGFEVLLDIFGFFSPTDQMVVLTSSHRWKMWANQELNQSKITVSSLTLPEFISKILQIAERHNLSTSHSKQFFSQMRHNINNDSITFLKTLEMIQEYIIAHKILQVSQVTIPGFGYGVVEKTGHLKQENKNKSFSYQVTRGKEVEVSKEGQGNGEGKGYRTMKPGVMCFPSEMSPQDKREMKWQASSGELLKINIDRFPTSPTFFLNNTTNFQTPTKKRPANLNATSHNRVPSIDNSAQHMARHINAKKTSHFKQSPLKESRKKSYGSQHGLSPFKFRNVFEEPQSTPLLKVTSATNLVTKGVKACGSSIYTSDKYTKEKSKKFSENYLFNEAVMINIKAPETPEPVQVDKSLSPYNSSSTKQLQNSRQIRQSDVLNAKLKANDLMGKQRNNHSVINVKKKEERGCGQGKRNLVVSNQFPERDGYLQVPSLGRKERNGNNEWKSTITGLFSDSQSIKMLKESIKMKNNNDQIFQKEYLKDVKLDLLDKLGRTAKNIFLEEGERSFNEMQLIEQVDEIKSGLESERDPDHYRREEEDNGFQFQTEMYVINPKK